MRTPAEAAVLVVLTTAPDTAVARAIASRVVDERLAACANIVPGVTSIYRWKGEVHEDDEVLVVFKTIPAGFIALRDRIVALHPYDVPEVLALPAPDGSTDYVRWVTGEVVLR